MTIIDKPKFEASSTPVPDNPEVSRKEESDSKSNGSTSTGGNPSNPNTSTPSDISSSSSEITASGVVLGKKSLKRKNESFADAAAPSLDAAFITKRLRLLESSYRSFLPDFHDEVSDQKYYANTQPTKAIKINIKPMMGEPFVVSISDDSYVFELREIVAERTGLSLSGTVLSFASDGKVLINDEIMLSDANITDRVTLNLTVKVTSGLETQTVNFEDGFDRADFDTTIGTSTDEDLEFYDVIYADDEGKLAEIVKLIDADRSGSSSNSSKTGSLAVKHPIPVSTISKILENVSGPPKSQTDLAIGKLSISSEEEREEEDRLHEEVIKSALGPRGAAIFQSPKLEAIPAERVVESSLTGRSNCHKCGRKCKLAQRFQCKCGHTFCPQHRYYDQHQCTFDFKSTDREAVQKSNPKIVGDKIVKL